MIAVVDVSLRSVTVALYNPDVIQQDWHEERVNVHDFLDDFSRTRMYNNMNAYRGDLVIGIRIAFGGDVFTEPTIMNEETMPLLTGLLEYSPAYMALIMRVVSCLRDTFPQSAVIGFFETSFFVDLPAEGCGYAIPPEFLPVYQSRRAGFNGIYHEYVARRFHDEKCISIVIDKKTTICALDAGIPRSISLGVTPLEGVMGRTSCGDIDPGLVLQFMHDTGRSVYDVDELLKNRSGFLGITGYDLTMREYTALRGRNKKVDLAFEVYQNHILKYVGEAVSILGTVDRIAFMGCDVDTMLPVIVSLLGKLSFLGISLKKMPVTVPQYQWTDITESHSRIQASLSRIPRAYILCTHLAAMTACP